MLLAVINSGRQHGLPDQHFTKVANIMACHNLPSSSSKLP
jgi:purine nucleoside phosphorylase